MQLMHTMQLYVLGKQTVDEFRKHLKHLIIVTPSGFEPESKV